ncbi:MAG: AAA family ATPase [Bacteroidales bacterium]
MTLSKEDILNKVSTYDILNHYLQPFHNFGSRLTEGKNISNPFLGERQKTPSFNIHCALPQHEWRFKDFATDDKGSCFDLVMRLFNLTFPEALELINRDFCLMLDSLHSPVVNPVGLKNPLITFSVSKRPFNQVELTYWQKFGISPETLKKFNVVALEEFTTNSKEGNRYTIKSGPEKFIFGYDYGDWMKLYKPLDEKKHRFQYLGNKTPGYVFGLAQLPERDDTLFITGGEKDVMTLSAHGFNAFSLNSETASLDKALVAALKLRFNNLIILYDNDDTGIRQADSLSLLHGLRKLVLPVLPDNGKDISDYFASGGKVETLKDWLSTSLSSPAPIPVDEDKCIFTSVELMAMGMIEPDYLLSPLMPRKGTAVLAGKPDTGKSQFARQLCITVALGFPDFLGFKINSAHRSALYVSTEDSMEATTYLMTKQFKGLNQSAQKNLRFIFSDTSDQEEVLSSLEQALAESPVDLIVIDSFSDIFKGDNNNNNMAMRHSVKPFDLIAKKHNCLILFIHHINKGAYRQAPGQEHIQGGAGLVQKVRLALQLSEGIDDVRFLSVVKGNYCPREYKTNSFILNFSEEDFLFTNTGELKPTKDIAVQPDQNDNDPRFSELKEIANRIFGDKLISYGVFVKQYETISGKSAPTAKRAHASLKKLGIIVEANGLYRLNKSGNTDYPESEEILNSSV